MSTNSSLIDLNMSDVGGLADPLNEDDIGGLQEQKGGIVEIYHEAQAKKKHSKRRMIIRMGIVVLILIVLGVILAVLIGSND